MIRLRHVSFVRQAAGPGGVPPLADFMWTCPGSRGADASDRSERPLHARTAAGSMRDDDAGAAPPRCVKAARPCPPSSAVAALGAVRVRSKQLARWTIVGTLVLAVRRHPDAGRSLSDQARPGEEVAATAPEPDPFLAEPGAPALPEPTQGRETSAPSCRSSRNPWRYIRAASRSTHQFGKALSFRDASSTLG